MNAGGPILVTGAAGFLGSHVVEALLDRGREVRALDLPEARWETYLGVRLADPRLTADRRDILDVPADDPVFTGIRAVIHCAGLADHAPSMAAPELYHRVNVGGMIRVLEAARLNGIGAVVNASSAAVYGMAEAPTREDHPKAPINPYGLSKWMAEEACEAWSRFYGIRTASLRIFNCYGPRAQTGGILVALMNRRRAGQALTLVGDGSQQRDFVYVSDIARALILAAEDERAHGAYNLGSGRPETLKLLAGLIGGPVEYLPAREGDIAIILADTARIRTELGWVPEVPLEEGIRRLLEAG